MRKSNVTEEQIINVLKSVESGQEIADACCTNSISEQIDHRWKARYGGSLMTEVYMNN
jgi:putative transposase